MFLKNFIKSGQRFSKKSFSFLRQTNLSVSFCFFILISLHAQGQANNNSPYSQFGLGDLQTQAFIPQTAMGGLGISNGTGISISNINPAILVRSRLTVVDLGAVVQYKNIKSNTQSQQSIGGNLQYIALAFPVAKNWTSSISLQPYSTVNYRFTSSEYIPNTATKAEYTFEGSGGLNTATFTNSIQLNKTLSLGLKINYLFGNITSEDNSFVPVNEGYTVASVKRINYGDFTFKTGLAYRQKLKEKLYFNAGGAVDFGTKVSAKRFVSVETRRGSTALTLADTLSRNEKGTIRLPGNYQFGLSLDDPLHWTVGMDFSYYQGSAYRSFDGNSSYKDGFTLALGGDWTPDINAATGYLNRVTFRTGVSYSKQSLTVNGKEYKLDDMNANIGFTLPVGRGFSFLNLAFAVGQRGTLDNNQLKENYVRGNIGITINDRWFQKRKID